ncbi:MAG: TonB-dependent receptor domain-containing protein, partial [Flavitalea sp.]
KGGAAAALYGSRSTAGFILITTKKCTKRKGVGIEINSNLVVEKINNVSDWQYDYGHGTLGAAPTNLEGANNIPLNSWGGKMSGQNVIQWDGESRPYVAVKDNLERFYRTGTNFTNTIKMYGGSDKMTYNFTVSDLANTSIVPNSSIHRNNFLLNTVITPMDKLTVNLNVRYIRERSKNRPRLSDSPGNANFTIGLMPTSWDVETFQTSMLDANGNENKFNNNDYVTNPYWATTRFGQRDTRDRFIGLIEAKYDLTSWLYVRGRLSTDQYTRTNFEYTPSGTKYSPGGQINDQTTNRFREFNGEWLVGSRKEFSKFGIDALVGGNMMIQKDEGQSFWGDNFFAPNFYHISNLQNRNTAFNYTEKRINSLFGSAEVNYNKFLYLTFTGRNDWFSTLSPENWSIFYPSVGASFVLSDAMTMPAFLDFAKIRTGWARVGGDRDPYGLSLPYGLGNPYNGLPVGNIGTGTIPNRGLKPFTVTTMEVGFETRMFDNRFGIDFTYYDRKTEDDIVSSQISGTSGFGSVLLNVGEVSNKGVELLLTGGLISQKNFSWDASFNVGYNKGVVVKISDQLTTAR